MPPRDAARDLLLGLLAFQNHFLDRAGLLGAFDDWNAHPDRPLAEILKERGALSESRLALIVALVEEHVRQHGDDPNRSLAAVSSIGSIRDELARLSDTDLLASLPIVATIDPYATRTGAAPAPGAPGSRFRVLRFHAKGGLGQVSVAMDDELDREVALKEIQEQHADHPHSRSRFVLEAEITGKLEHPGIIPVYGLGHDLTGRPYYAMRFVRGDSLQEAIQRFHGPDGPKDATARALALRELLGRFLDVCDAIAYAHSRGVLHRDLKPGNVMLGKFGETLVVDWGLAKPLGAGESADGEASIKPTKADTSGSATQAGVAIGTPAYMSPEQAEGRLDLLGPRSDVYGLGATLYALLTGHPPVESGDILRRVSVGDIDPLRKHISAVPRALEAICLKALALRPENRYADAWSLAADVKRWLADEPVTARRDPLPTRAWRWVRKHRTATTAAAAVLVVGSIGLAVAWRREAALGTDLAGALGRERAAKAVADRRLDETLGAVKDYYTGVGAEVLLEQPQLKGLRDRLLAKPRQFYEKLTADLAASGADDIRSRALLARARFDLGKILLQVGEPGPAGLEFVAAVAAFERLAAEQPGVPGYRDGLAGSYTNLGNAQRATGATAEAIASYGKAVAQFERLAADQPGVPKYRNGLAMSYMNLSTAQYVTGATADAVASYAKAIELRVRLAAEQPGVPEYRNGLANSYSNLGNAQYTTGATADAIASHGKAIEQFERLAADQPGVPEYRNGLANSYSNLGVAQADTGATAGAVASYGKAIEQFERLAAEQPGVPEYRDRLANSYYNLGVVQYVMGATAEAIASHGAAIEHYERLAADQPGVPKYRAGLAMSYNNLGAAQRATGATADAIASHGKAIAMRRRLVAAHPQAIGYQHGLGGSLCNLGLALLDAGRARPAESALREGVSVEEGVFRRAPNDPAVRQYLNNNYMGLAAALRAQRRGAEAAAVTRQRRGLWPGVAGEQYNMACELALSMPIVDEAERDAMGAEAMEALREAVISGWSDAVHTAHDADLVALRGREDFRRVLAGMFDQKFPVSVFAGEGGGR